MKLFGYTAREWLRVGFAAVSFILVAKWLAPKAGIPALSQTVEKV